MTTYCITCANLPGCRLVQSADGVCDIDLLITEDRPVHCSDWSSLDSMDLRVRATIFENCGIGGLRAINQAPEILRGQQEDEDMSEVPDFINMITEGMTLDEREHQLRFEETEGEPLPRNSFPLRKYASDPEGPLAKPTDVVMFWSVKQLIQAILKAEFEAGWITKPKVTRRKKEDMATKKITIRKPTSVKSKGKASKVPAKAGGKVGQPATRKKVIPQEVEESGESSEGIEAIISAALHPLMQAVAELKKGQVGIANQLKEVGNDATTAVTALHDVVIKLLVEDEDEQSEMSLLHQGMTVLDYAGDNEGNE